MTRLSEIVKTLYVKEDVMGDVWHNNIIKEVFEGVKSNKRSIRIAQYISDIIGYDLTKNKRNWYSQYLTKTQLLKLKAIINAKSNKTLQDRVYSFGYLITKSAYSNLFNKKQIEAWVELCNDMNWKHGLVKVNRANELEKVIDKAFS